MLVIIYFMFKLQICNCIAVKLISHYLINYIFIELDVLYTVQEISNVFSYIW